ncbi:hypothetical protein C8A01DRAFT_19193 [Parachaetomium inaequale]|uniref:BZIP domain-containing protein n=1 Tax=Parachaetomium inaequale TaxID=2588326 RepID=A0AAN6PDE4_9PEZI|nr:hypothetical protein C8A01DRAFT_19193 [Parachaetomium inaequale]
MPPLLDDRPRTRHRVRKPPPTLAIPDIEHDAAERKRVLNVLAQRRYRQRKRESRVESEKSRQSSAQTSDGSRHELSPHSGTAGDVVDSPFLLPEDSSSPSLDFSQMDQASLDWLTCPLDGSTTFHPLHASNEIQGQPPSLPPVFLDIRCNSPNSNASALTCSPASANNDTQSEGIFSSDPDGTASLDGAATPASTSFPDRTTFSDSYFLAVPPLTLLRGLLRIASRLNAASSIGSLASTSPFNLGLGPDSSQLPAAWQPTPTQLSVPHHPLLDMLPWPSVRDRIIGVMALANDSGDGTTTGSRLVDFVYDMEDGAEGMRIWGSDPYDEASWEVGQVVFERWWFVFDKKVVEQSNTWWRRRGAAPLRALAM